MEESIALDGTNGKNILKRITKMEESGKLPDAVLIDVNLSYGDGADFELWVTDLEEE
jgi:hypothetical protein